jgi:hypothetical protein
VSSLNSRNFRRPSFSALLAFVGISAVAGLLVAVSVTPAVAVTGMAAQQAIGAFDGLPSYLQIGTLDQRSTIYAKQGSQQVPIATFYAQNRQDVSYNDIAKVVRDAAIDTEDPTFYKEGGINISGTIRGALSTGLGTNVSGGSSITQQYVKNVLVQQCDAVYINNGTGGPVTKAQQASYQTCYQNASGVSIDRKLKEMRYAIGIDKRYTKQQVITGYLNITGFGGQVYGIQAAAQYYFNTTAKNLSLVQAATLIAILNNPSNLRIDQPANAANGSANGYAQTLARGAGAGSDQDSHHSADHAAADRVCGRGRVQRRVLLQLRRVDHSPEPGLRSDPGRPRRSVQQGRSQHLHDAGSRPAVGGPERHQRLHSRVRSQARPRVVERLDGGGDRSRRDDGAEQDIQRHRVRGAGTDGSQLQH